MEMFPFLFHPVCSCCPLSCMDFRSRGSFRHPQLWRNSPEFSPNTCTASFFILHLNLWFIWKDRYLVWGIDFILSVSMRLDRHPRITYKELSLPPTGWRCYLFCICSWAGFWVYEWAILMMGAMYMFEYIGIWLYFKQYPAVLIWSFLNYNQLVFNSRRRRRTVFLLRSLKVYKLP